ncbi:MAG: hypothetical protein GY724_26160 [Actinomycetia bacterium]|nr:hypothetical protein [Actinomycetes bacterium]
MSRYSSAQQLGLAALALVLGASGIAVFRSVAPATDALEMSDSAFNIVTPVEAAASAQAAIDAAKPQPIALPIATDTAVVVQVARPADQEAAPSTTAAAQANKNNDNNNNDASRDKNNDGYDDPTKVKGYDVHAFNEHVISALGAQMMAPQQGTTGSFEQVGPFEIRARSTITALRPVIEQGIADVLERNPNATGIELERKVAKRLTDLNDWKNLNNRTKERMMILSGVDINNLNERVREDVVNHLLHSPLPFGDLDQVITPDFTIDLGYTHTLDKDWTQVAHLGDGVFQIWLISNNNNGSHTGHVMGSFKVQLTANTSLGEARRIGNEMVENQNKNNKLYLDEAARNILYGATPLLDYRSMTEQERRATYAGKGLGTYAGNTGPITTPEPEPTTTTTTVPDTTDTTDPDTTDTTDPNSTDTTVPDSTVTTVPETTASTVPETTASPAAANE